MNFAHFQRNSNKSLNGLSPILITMWQSNLKTKVYNKAYLYLTN